MSYTQRGPSNRSLSVLRLLWVIKRHGGRLVGWAEVPQKADGIAAAPKGVSCVPITAIWRSFNVCVLGGESKGARAPTFSTFLDFNSFLPLQILNISQRTGPFGQCRWRKR